MMRSAFLFGILLFWENLALTSRWSHHDGDTFCTKYCVELLIVMYLPVRDNLYQSWNILKSTDNLPPKNHDKQPWK